MSQTTDLSNSKFQLDLENEILDAISIHIGTVLINKPVTFENVSFHFDFTNSDLSIIGEIYSCSFPLKPGHQRKIKSDILKMISYEKLVGEKQKYLVLTISRENTGNIIIPDSRIVSDKNGASIFGEKSWFSKTLKVFDIKVMYYVLSEVEKAQLDDTRSKQKKGINHTNNHS